MTETECRHHIDKLKILNLVANLKGEPSPDDYEKDICALIGDEKPLNGNCVPGIHKKAEENYLNNGVVDWIQNVKHDPSQLEAIACISPSISPAKSDISPVKLSNGDVPKDADIGTMVSNEESHDLLSVSIQSTDRSNDSVEKDKSGDVFIDFTKDTTVKLNENVKHEVESNEDPSERKKMKTYVSSMGSSECQSSQYSTLKRKKRHSDSSKPPNVLVYSESNDIRANVISTIKHLLHPDRYTIYELKTEQLKTSIWIDNTTLVNMCLICYFY